MRVKIKNRAGFVQISQDKHIIVGLDTETLAITHVVAQFKRFGEGIVGEAVF